MLRATIGSSRKLLALTALAAALTITAPATASTGPGAFTTKGAWSFASAPGLHPPKLLTQGRVDSRKLAVGDFLIDSFPHEAVIGPMTGQGGPLIVDQNLQPVWFAPVSTQLVSGDLQQETYQGQPVLVWWQGQLTTIGATIRGEVVVVDQHYHRVATLSARRPWKISLHDAVIGGSDIWVTVYRYVHNENLVPYGGRRNGTVYDAGVQEYDLSTGKLLYTWDALDHIPLSASEQPASVAPATGGTWDAYHLNSIQLLPSNQVLISMRNTWAAYLIDTATGKIVWTLGGKRSNFKFGRGAGFAWQHDAQFVSSNEVTLFNDNCCRQISALRFAAPNGPSQGIVLRLDQARRTASLVAAYPHSPRINVYFLGSMQLLPGGNAVVGWGSLPYFSEHTRSGRQLLDVRLPGKDESYRALFSSTWVGTPYYPPSGAARRSSGRTTVYASWNGATEVARWEVLGGSTVAQMTTVASARRTGFETPITLKKGGLRFFEVRALTAGGVVLGTSRPFS